MCHATQHDGNSNLGIMGIEMTSQYLHTFIMPQIIEEEQKERDSNETEKLQAMLNK